jgi:hypothetical protein
MRGYFALIAFLPLILVASCTDRAGSMNHEITEDQDFERMDWGQEVSLDEIVFMAKTKRIREIQWHVLPNVLRVLAADGGIFHLKNEYKGVDLRNVLIDAGVKIGPGGIPFRHFF